MSAATITIPVSYTHLGKHWAMTIACIASLSVCMTLNTFATLAEVNVDSMVNYLGQQNEMVVYVDPEADDATIQSVGERITATPGVSRVQYMSKEDVLNQYRGYMADYAVLLDEFENDNPFKANYRVSLADLSQMQAMSQNFQSIPGVYSVTAPIEMTQTFVEAVSYTHLDVYKRQVWNGVSIVNISREFLNSNGAEKHQNVHVEQGTVWQPQWAGITDVYKRQPISCSSWQNSRTCASGASCFSTMIMVVVSLSFSHKRHRRPAPLP